jgi:Fic family protein
VILKLDGLLKLDRARIAGVGRGARSALLVYEQLLRHPIVAAAVLREKTGLTDATVNAALRHLRNIGIVEETTGRRRNRLFCYQKYMTLLNAGLV